MSSTNRSNARNEHIADYYITPVKDIIQFLGEFDRVKTIDLSTNENFILDPCAGGDEAHEMSYPKALKEYYAIDDSYLKTIDIRNDSCAEIKDDYLSMKLDKKPYVIISNPPFNKALEFIKKALDVVRDDGYVIMLLRLNFLETKSRKEFFDYYMPKWIFVHHKRMSFTEKGGTDSIAYCHMVWQKGDYPEFSQIKVI